MDVGGLRLHRTGDEVVHQADHGRLARHVLQAAHVVLARLAGVRRAGLGGNGLAAAVEPLQRPLDVAGGHHPALHRPLQQVAQGGGGLGVERVGDGHQQAVAPVGDGDDAVALEELQLQAVRHQRRLGQLARVQQRQAEELGQQAGEVRLGDQPEPGQHQVEALAGLPLRPERPVQGQLVQHAAAGQEGGQPLDQTFVGRIDASMLRRSVLIDHRSPR